MKHFFFRIMYLNRQWQHEHLLDVIRQPIIHTLMYIFKLIKYCLTSVKMLLKGVCFNWLHLKNHGAS